MFPAFGFGAQIPPSFQVMEYVKALHKITKSTSGGDCIYSPDCVFCVLTGVT